MQNVQKSPALHFLPSSAGHLHYQSQIATLSQPAGQENGLKIFVCVDTEKGHCSWSEKCKN